MKNKVLIHRWLTLVVPEATQSAGGELRLEPEV